MNLHGLDELRKHAPALSQPGGLMRPLLAIGAVFVLTTLFFLAADRGFAEWMPDGEIVVLALGFLLVSRFFLAERCLPEEIRRCWLSRMPTHDSVSRGWG